MHFSRYIINNRRLFFAENISCFLKCFQQAFERRASSIPLYVNANFSTFWNRNVSKAYPFCPFQGIVVAGSAARRTTTCLTQTRSTSTSSSVSCRRGRQERLHRSIPCCSTRTRGLRRSRCMRSPSSSIIPLQSTSPTPSVSAGILHSNNPL